FVTSGIRLGSPAATARGFGEAEFREVGRMIDEVLTAALEEDNAEAVTARVHEEVKALCRRFPIYDRASA
ncbi:MAG: serine hydroxymethyltransferase, partial [Gluconobacter oxydans]